MAGVDYLQFRQSYRNSLIHSPKGTTWKNHKYIKKIDGRYIYESVKDKARFAGDKIEDFGSNVGWELTKLKRSVIEEYYNQLGKVLNKLQKKQLAYVMSKEGLKYKYSKSDDSIDTRRGLSSIYGLPTNLSLDDFVLIDGEVYKKDKNKSYKKVGKQGVFPGTW